MQALDLIGPVYRMMDSFVGVREKTSALFAYGLLLMKQQDLQEARYIQVFIIFCDWHYIFLNFCLKVGKVLNLTAAWRLIYLLCFIG